MKEKLNLQNQIEIKPLMVEDIEQLDPILRQHVRDRDTTEILANEIASIKSYMNGEKDEYGRIRNYFVAKSPDKKIIGCMSYTTIDPDMTHHFSELNPFETVELVNAFVDSEFYHGGGIGKKLFETLCSFVRNEGKKFLIINSGPRYKNSWGFYDRVCDQSFGFIKNKYGLGGDAKTWLKIL